ncbi:MAG: DUF6179 domain-containing protein [Clostridiales bacterium]|nr:DUF6179 domain-containing protein [Clostridiales bacterium]
MTDALSARLPDPAALRGRDYLISLLEEGRRCGLLSGEETARLLEQSLPILARQTAAWTRGAGSSVPLDRAQALLESVLYTAGLALKAYPTPAAALEALRREGLQALFEAGQRTLRRRLQTARTLHRRLCAGLFETPNVFYRATAVDGIGGFFRLYQPQLLAQETHITADYPVFLMPGDVTGVEFIGAYLAALDCENRLLSAFPARTVHRLLCRLEPEYDRLVLNLFEPVMTAALCCALTGRPVRTLDCGGAQAVRPLLEGRTQAELTALLQTAQARMSSDLAFAPGPADYLRRSLPRLAAALEQAAQLGTLERVVLTPIPEGPSAEPAITLEEGARLSPPAFSRLLAALREEKPAAERAALLSAQVQTAGDLAELLTAAELPLRELSAVLALLPQAAWAALAALYETDAFVTDEREARLCAALRALRAALPPPERARLDAMTQALRRPARGGQKRPEERP